MSAKIAIIYYSVYGHTKKLADTAAAAIKKEGKAEVTIFQVPEILPAEVLEKLHAAPRTNDPVISAADLTKFDGFIFVIPTRYGRAVSQFSAFFDTTGALWATGALRNKLATVFTSTASQHGGQETTALTTLPFFAHHGIIYVPLGYPVPELQDISEVVGGSPWGAGTLAGDGSRQPSEKENTIVTAHATNFTSVVAQFVRGA